MIQIGFTWISLPMTTLQKMMVHHPQLTTQITGLDMQIAITVMQVGIVTPH